MPYTPSLNETNIMKCDDASYNPLHSKRIPQFELLAINEHKTFNTLRRLNATGFHKYVPLNHLLYEEIQIT